MFVFRFHSKIYSVNITRTGHVLNRLCDAPKCIMHSDATAVVLRTDSALSMVTQTSCIFHSGLNRDKPPSQSTFIRAPLHTALNRELAAGSLSLSHSRLRTHYPQSQAVGGLSVKMIYFRNKYPVSLSVLLRVYAFP